MISPIPKDIWVRRAKPALCAVLGLPLALLALDVWRELQVPGSGLGPDPVDALIGDLGSWAITMLLATLAVSPLSRLVHKPWLIRFRRMVGLWAFAYVVLHFVVYLGLLAGFDLANIAADVVKRPYITVGFGALLALVPLAITSTRSWQRRLGRRWRALHRLVYAIAIAAWIHVLWLSKGSFADPLIYGLVLALLFGERIVFAIRTRRRRAAKSARTLGACADHARPVARPPPATS